MRERDQSASQTTKALKEEGLIRSIDGFKKGLQLNPG
jgi:DNA-binding IscR family transcriptional regulator